MSNSNTKLSNTAVALVCAGAVLGGAILGGVITGKKYRAEVCCKSRRNDGLVLQNQALREENSRLASYPTTKTVRYMLGSTKTRESVEVKVDPTNLQTTITSIVDNCGRECVLPDGDITVWKACRAIDPKTGNQVNVYVKLRVPSGVARVTTHDAATHIHSDEALTYKCRIATGFVEEIVDKDGNKYYEATSFVHPTKSGTYRVGQWAVPDSYNGDPKVSCGSGINVHPYQDQCDQWFKL